MKKGGALKLRKRKQATGCWHCLQGWESGASLGCVGSTWGKLHPWERCWARDLSSHLHRAGVMGWAPSHMRGWVFSSGFRKEGATKAVLPSRLELHSLTFGFCSLYFKRAVLMCAQLCQMVVCKKRPESRREEREACPCLGPGETWLLKLLSAAGEQEGVVWTMEIGIVVFISNTSPSYYSWLGFDICVYTNFFFSFY